ncbi:hypothetical protein PTI98_009553 [Pleurotus ostreatus]|nr:hypothetical protein PTI98_009553 [Pleurotus ostreatus]
MLPPTLEELRLHEVKFDSSQRNAARRDLELKAPKVPGTLTIHIKLEHFWDPLEESFPSLSNYEMLSQLVCHLRESEQGSCLQSIVLVIRISTSPIPGKRPYDGHQTRELAKLEKGLARLVEENVLDADLTLESEDSEPYMRCKIRRA